MLFIKQTVLFFIFSSVQLSALSLELNSKQTLTHFTLYYPPYWDGTEKQITGLHARLSRMLYSKAGLDINMERVPYARVQQRLFPEDVAITAYGASPLTDDQFLFPIPQTRIELKIYGLGSKPVDGLEQLIGKDVAIKRGYPLGDYEVIRIEKKYNTALTNTVEQAIRMLLLDRVDYIITLDDPFQKDIKKIDLQGKKIWSRSLAILDGWPIAIIKSHPRAEELYEKIKRAYDELLEAGIITYKNHRLLLTEDL